MSESTKESSGPKYTRATHETILLLLEKGKGAPMELWFAFSTFASWRTGWCNPSWEVLQKRSGLSRASIHRAIARLEELDLLRRRSIPGGKSEYWLFGTRLIYETGITDETPPVPPEILHPSHRRDYPRPTGETGNLNENQGTSLKNEGGNPPASPPADPDGPEDLVALSRRQKLYAATEGQRKGVIDSLVGEHGYDRARAILRATTGGDIHRVLRTGRTAARIRDEVLESRTDGRPRCREPACMKGRIPDDQASGPKGTVWKPCPACGGALQTSA